MLYFVAVFCCSERMTSMTITDEQRMKNFLRLVNSRWRMRLFLLWKLPAAWFVGISVRSCDGEKAVVRLPYGWRSQNPFRSTYFAAQCAAGELSTGILALAHLQDKPPVSMLVTRVEAEFLKKASDVLLFTCEDGKAMEETVKKALETGEPQIFRATSIGRLPDGTEAARIWITWSFKRK
jgi:hypothetical protein